MCVVNIIWFENECYEDKWLWKHGQTITCGTNLTLYC